MPSKTKPQEIIEKSGNDFHFQVADFLRSREWEAEVSPYYSDPATNKPREIDIVAVKKYTVSDWHNSDSFAVRLFIECKYIKDENVLWFEDKNYANAMELAKDNNIMRDLEDINLRNDQKTHHYVQEGQVMKLAAKAGNSDPLYEAMNGCLNAMVFYTEHQYPDVPITIDYPIIAVDSFKKLFKRNQTNQAGYDRLADNFQMEVKYSFVDKKGRPASKYFLLDVVEGDKLDDFLALLEMNDIQILKSNLHWQMRRRRQERAIAGAYTDDYT